MRLIDADALYDMYVELEEQAIRYIQIGPHPLVDPRIWSAIRVERTAYKHSIVDAPTIDAAQVIHGEWIEDGDNQPMSCDKMYCCSNCKQNRRPESQFTNYCSNCGAKMMDMK